MSENQKKQSRVGNPYLRSALYYIVMWGTLSLTYSYISIDLNNRGVTELQWGIISAAKSFVVFLVTPLITRLADKYNKRVKVLTIIQILNAFALLLYMIPNRFSGFLIVNLIANLVAAGIMPIGDGIIVRMAKRYDLEFGRIRMWGSLGFAVFGILSGVIWGAIGYSMLYWVAFFATLLIAFLASRLEEPTVDTNVPLATQKVKTISFKGKDLKVFFRDWALVLFLLALLFRAASEIMFQSFSAIYINQITQSAFFVGLLRGGAAILEIFVMIFLQSLIRRFGLESVLLSGFVVQAIGIGVFAFSINPWIMYIGTILRSAGFALYFVSSVQFIDLHAGEKDAATYQGFSSVIGRGLAPLLFTPLAGWVYQQWNGQAVFILSMVTCFLAAVVFTPIMIRSLKEHSKPEQAAT